MAKSRALEKAIAQRDFAKVEEEYRLIEQKGVSVIVPYEDQKELYAKVRSEGLQKGLTKSLLPAGSAVDCHLLRPGAGGASVRTSLFCRR